MSQKINAKYMELGIKKGWSINDFCKDLEISEEKFMQLLMKYFKPQLVGHYKQKMNANLKKASNKNKAVEPDGGLAEIDVSSTFDQEVDESSVDDKVDTMESLKVAESLVRDYINDTEISIRELFTEKRHCKEKLRKSKSILERILKQLKEEQEKINSVIARLSEIKTEIGSLKSEKSKAFFELNEVLKKIDDLSKIIVVCKVDGRILCDDISIPEDLDIEKTLQYLMEIPLLEELTIKELKYVAHLKAIKDYLSNTFNRNVEFKFEKESNISVAIGLLEEELKS